MLTTLTLAEPLVTSTVALLNLNLNTTIDQYNATVTDTFTVPHALQVLDYMPVPSTLEAGMPAIGVQRLGATFEDDLRYSMHAVHQFAIVAVMQHVDQRTLAWQLDRMSQIVANVIQTDRLVASSSSILKTQGGAWAVDFVRLEPGPLLADLDPTSPDSPPRSYLSWTALIYEAKKTEV